MDAWLKRILDAAVADALGDREANVQWKAYGVRVLALGGFRPQVEGRGREADGLNDCQVVTYVNCVYVNAASGTGGRLVFEPILFGIQRGIADYMPIRHENAALG